MSAATPSGDYRYGYNGASVWPIGVCTCHAPENNTAGLIPCRVHGLWAGPWQAAWQPSVTVANNIKFSIRPDGEAMRAEDI